MGRGIFFVLYGPNNLGKSTQLNLLEEVWKEMGRPYKRIKYPIYDSPTGVIINQALRGDENGKKLELTEEELQYLFAENRRVYETEVCSMLADGVDILAEDYIGTGLAWGLTRGVDRKMLDEYNRDLLVPDVSVVLDGCRFTSGIEKGHRNESAETEVWERNREIHLQLAKEFGWEVVDANQNQEKVCSDILGCVAKKF